MRRISITLVLSASLLPAAHAGEGARPRRLWPAVEVGPSHFAFTLPLGQRYAVSPMLGFGFRRSGGTVFSLGGRLQRELGSSRKVQPYVGAELTYTHNALEFVEEPPAAQREVAHSLAAGPVIGTRWFPTPRFGLFVDGGYRYTTRRTFGDIGWGRARLDEHNWFEASAGIVFRFGSPQR